MELFELIVYFQIHDRVTGDNARIEPYGRKYKVYKRIPQRNRWWRPGVILENKDSALVAFIDLENEKYVTHEELIRCNMDRQDWFPIKEEPPQRFSIQEQIAISIIKKDPMAMDFAADILEARR